MSLSSGKDADSSCHDCADTFDASVLILPATIVLTLLLLLSCRGCPGASVRDTGPGTPSRGSGAHCLEHGGVLCGGLEVHVKQTAGVRAVFHTSLRSPARSSMERTLSKSMSWLLRKYGRALLVLFLMG